MGLGALRLLALLLAATAAVALEGGDVWSREDIIDFSRPDEEGEPLSSADFELAQLTPDADLSRLGIQTEPNSAAHNVHEGDIKTPANFESVRDFAQQSSSLNKNAIRNRWRQWPRGEIPYVLSSRYSSYARRTIAAAFQEYHDKTCIKFLPRNPRKHRDYVYIHPDDGCYSLVGRTGGRQSLSLDAGCIQKGTIIHELMHTVGFFHEQSRTDRDDYIRIVWENVMRDARDQFEKYSLRTITSLGEDYDYGSIMHYGPRAFSRNGRPTIVPIARDGSTLRVSMGQRRRFSPTDLRKINRLYNCRREEEDESGEEGREGRGDEKEEEDGSGECRDLAAGPDRRCFFWKRLGYCRRYETVQRRCRRTCGLCDGGASTTAPTRPPPPTQPPPTTDSEDRSSSSLKDLNDNCRKWALERQLCNKAAYKSLMGKLCAKSCADVGRRRRPDEEEDRRRSGEDAEEEEEEEDDDREEACRDENPARCELIATLRRCPEYRLVSGQKCLTKNGWSNDLAKLYFRACRRTCGLCDVKICRVVPRPRS